MKIRQWKHGPLAACLGLTCWWPATALAQDCSDETKLLSDEWFLTKVDCGADQLVKEGKSALSEAGMNLARSALDHYLPGLSNLIFEDEDDFAADFADLKLHMEAQTDAIITQLLAERTRMETNQLLTALNAMEDWNDDPLYIRAGNRDLINEVDDGLTTVTFDLMWPIEADFSEIAFGLDFTEMTPPDIDRFHALMEIIGMRTEIFPMMAAAEYYDSIVNDSENPTSQELADVTAGAHEETVTELDEMLRDMLEPYLDAVNSKNIFRLRSDQRFSNFLSGNACGAFGYTYSKAGIGEDPFTGETYRFYYTDDGLGGLPPSCTGTYAGMGSYRIEPPNGPVSTGRMSHSLFVSLVQAGYENNRLLAYEGFLLSGYGAARPTISRWYRLAGRVPPVLAIDQHLRTGLRRSTRAVTVLDALTNVSSSPLSPLDWRAAEDMVLESGDGPLYIFELAASAADFLKNGGPHPIVLVRRFLHGDAGTEVFKEMATAKFNAITLPL